MSAWTMRPASDAAMRWKPHVQEWLPIAIGLLALFVPMFIGLFEGLWRTEEQGHGPIILVLSLWLIWRKWPAMMQKAPPRMALTGWPVFVIGLLFHVLGRSQQIPVVEVASFIWVLAGIVLLKRGFAGLKVLWFPFFFMLFMLPLPGIIVSELTMPMKTAVSWVTEHVLFAVGYPIARDGVVLQIGQYQLLVADACAGLQTLLTLESLGLFYLNVVQHASAFRNIVLALLIVPISFTANVIRVMTLTLITYHFGDAAGQGFLHGFAGMVLFFSALILIVGIDALLQMWVRYREGRRHADAAA